MSSTENSSAPPHSLRGWSRLVIGPGLIMAATGVGASDWVTSTVNGARFGYRLLWIILVGALVKGLLNEALARWQLVTGHTLLTGWRLHLPRWFRWLFFGYLLLWTALLGGSLAAACGMAAQAMLPLPLAPAHATAVWGMLHIGAGVAVIRATRYDRFERIMSAVVLLMFCTTIGAAVLTVQHWPDVFGGLIPRALPAGSVPYILSNIGGLGGSVSVLAYGYWLHEARRSGPQWIPATRLDLGLSYLLTAVFNLGAILIGAFALHPAADIVLRTGLVHDVAAQLSATIGWGGAWLFRLGFWGAVVGTLLGCLHGIPYLAADLMRPHAGADARTAADGTALRASPWYRRFLYLMAVPPLIQLWLITPVALVMLFTLLASLFTPLLAGSLLYLTNHADWMGGHRNRWWSNLGLACALALFLYLLGVDVWEAIGG